MLPDTPGNWAILTKSGSKECSPHCCVASQWTCRGITADIPQNEIAATNFNESDGSLGDIFVLHLLRRVIDAA